MPRDTVPEIDLSHPVYEDLPDLILKALMDPNTQDILCDPNGLVRVHALGTFNTICFLNIETRLRFIRKVAVYVNRYFERKFPILRAILPNRERLEAAFDSVSPDGISFVLRVPGPVISLPEMVDRGAMTLNQKLFLEDVAGMKNIIVAGGAGSGKTTMVRAILESPRAKTMRQVSIEADPEVQKPENGIRLIDIEPEPGSVEIPFMRLLRSALRLLPEMVIVSEVLNAEHAYAFVHAARGHVGMSTIHARTPLLAPRAVQELGKMVGGIPTHDVALACEVVVQVEKDGTGGRRVSEIVTIGVESNDFVAKRAA